MYVCMYACMRVRVYACAAALADTDCTFKREKGVNVPSLLSSPHAPQARRDESMQEKRVSMVHGWCGGIHKVVTTTALALQPLRSNTNSFARTETIESCAFTLHRAVCVAWLCVRACVTRSLNAHVRHVSSCSSALLRQLERREQFYYTVLAFALLG
jgi:hypothetical protein